MTSVKVEKAGTTNELHFTEDNIDNFLHIFEERDKKGDTLQYFADAEFRYFPKCTVDTSLDPYSDEYVAQQITLYEEISARAIDQKLHEQAPVDIEKMVALTNPCLRDAALHLSRLCKAFRHAEVASGGRIIDFGPGVGISSELAAYLGHRVTGIDINPDYVEVLNRRAKRTGNAIEARCSGFEDVSDGPVHDGAIFYESLHHAIRPWVVLDKVRSLLKPDGKVILAGEPINDYWWPTWGMRLDSVSVYVMRKWGWFENGWSLPFLEKMLTDAGFRPVTIPDADPAIGPVVIGLMPDAEISWRPPEPEPVPAASKKTFWSKIRGK